MAEWNTNPSWVELTDIVAQKVTSTTGITDAMFNTLMENVLFCYNHLAAADVRVGTVTVETLEPGQAANVLCEETVQDSFTYLNFLFQLPRGAQGLRGEKGDKGDKGDQGIQGLKGDKGEQGVQGYIPIDWRI